MPSSKNYKRDYKQENKYKSKPAEKKKRANRNKARRIMEKAGKVRKGDGKDVAHKDNNTNNNKKSNLKVSTRKANRSFKRTKTASRKRK